jgi:anthranilate phosphoribosyltransferase
MIDEVIRRVEARENLSQQEMADAIGLIMRAGCSEHHTARLLLALCEKGETVAEVAGAAQAMRQYMTPIRTRRTGVVDTCGTGGDGSGTFNISTAAALVTAAAGVPVAKHGNRSITSRSGSADVLAALGVGIEADVRCVETCLDELGIGFCFAPLLHRAMQHVATVRKRLAVPTIFNLLGPLANPAGAPLQLLGVGKRHLQPLLGEALALLGTQRALVIHGDDGLDEVTLAAATLVWEAGPDGPRQYRWTPADFGLPSAGLQAMQVAGPAESAVLIREILAGHPGPPRDIVVANAAAALWLAGRDASLIACARLAAEAIDSGAARTILARLVEITNA